MHKCVCVSECVCVGVSSCACELKLERVHLCSTTCLLRNMISVATCVGSCVCVCLELLEPEDNSVFRLQCCCTTRELLCVIFISLRENKRCGALNKRRNDISSTR